MKKILVLYTLVFCHFAISSEDISKFMESVKAQTYCEDSYQQENGKLLMIETNSTVNLYVFKQGSNSKLLLVNLLTWEEQTLMIQGRVSDISLTMDKLHVLTYDKFRTYNLNTFVKEEEFRTLPKNMNYQRDAHAMGFYMDTDFIYIAHGEYGVIKVNRLNPESKIVISPEPPHVKPGHRSMVTDIVGNDSSLFFVYDNITNSSKDRGFEGLGIWNKSKNLLDKFIPLNQKIEAFYLPKMKLTSNQIVMQNLHLIFKYDLKRLKKARYMKPVKRIWKVANGKFTHRALVYNDKIAGCIKDNNSYQNSSVVHK